MTLQTDPIIEFINETLELAGQELNARFNTTLQIKTKKDDSIVTDADLASEKIIIDRISKHFPNDAIYSEEAGLSTDDRASGQAIWIIDPLDGTSNFANHYPYFCVSIGRGVFNDNNEIIMQHGGIIDPIHNKTYLTARGQGAFCNDRAMHVTEPHPFNRTFLVTGFYYLKDDALKQQVERFNPLVGMKLLKMEHNNHDYCCMNLHQ